eukprot:1693782-Rhodomonas_salina.1
MIAEKYACRNWSPGREWLSVSVSVCGIRHVVQCAEQFSCCSSRITGRGGWQFLAAAVVFPRPFKLQKKEEKVYNPTECPLAVPEAPDARSGVQPCVVSKRLCTQEWGGKVNIL